MPGDEENAAGLVIAVDDPQAEDVRRLVERHLAFARGESPPEHVHALDTVRLFDSAVTLFGARRNGRLVGVGAVKHLDASHAEIKTMHTAESERGRGIGTAMVAHLVSFAAAREFRRISLETGTTPAFTPARVLYETAGFRRCEPFGAYSVNPHSVCMTMLLGS